MQGFRGLGSRGFEGQVQLCDSLPSGRTSLRQEGFEGFRGFKALGQPR